MIINQKEYKIAAVMLMMEQEFNVTKIALSSLMNSVKLESGFTISILLNGSVCEEIERYCAAIKSLHYYSSQENLGVAAGRNFLLTRPEVIGSDIIMFLDNDFFLTKDYVRGMCEFLVSHEDAGIVGPIMLGAWGFVDIIGTNGKIIPDDLDTVVVPGVASSAVKERWLNRGVEENIYNIGEGNWFLTDCIITPHTIFSYLKRLNAKRLLKLYPYRPIRFDPRMLDTIKKGDECIMVSIVSGGGQVFHSDLITRIGLLEDAFSPWGYEDHEFCIRALKAGYRNYTNCNTIVLHGTDDRRTDRGPSWHKYHFCRGRAIVIRKAVASRLLRVFLLFELLLNTLIFDGFSCLIHGHFLMRPVLYGIRGWLKGISTVIHYQQELIEQAKEAKLL